MKSRPPCAPVPSSSPCPPSASRVRALPLPAIDRPGVPRIAAGLLSGLGLLSTVGCTGGQRLALCRVVLYQNGIGYFERSGELSGSRYRLRLRSHEVGDVLKSLVVIDGSAGDGAGPSQPPVTVVVPQPRQQGADTDGKSGKDGVEYTHIDVHTARGGWHPLTVAYAAPTPVWKPAYRVVLPSPAAAAEGGGSRGGVLQAWAIVDNLSGESWNGVELTLATGAPLTFALDLQAPRFVARPDVSGQLVQPVVTGLVLAEKAQAPQLPDRDSDGDRIPDRDDKCPFEPETYNGIDDSDGCPDRGRVIVSASRLQILDRVYFERGSAVLKPASTPILDAIVATLRGNPQLTLVEVQGHACGEPHPQEISQSRADAVRAYLVDHGVAGGRLRARGYGSDRPTSPETTEAACQKNRRIELHIIQTSDESADDGERPPHDSVPPRPSTINADTLAASSRPLATLTDSAGGARYRIDQPITLPMGSSTMVALLTLRGGTEDIYLFRPDGNVAGSSRHPLRAARVQVGSPLEPGPVAVFSDGGYVGEGLLPRVHAGETTFIPYALDSATSIRVSRMQSPSREIGTQTSVAQPVAPGRSDKAA